jgi:hypothetical protein
VTADAEVHTVPAPPGVGPLRGRVRQPRGQPGGGEAGELPARSGGGVGRRETATAPARPAVLGDGMSTALNYSLSPW